jgi:deazaflavin-dependent oxidoreductase (nitroreductase family)
MSIRNVGMDLLLKALNRAHRTLLTVSGGRIGWSIGSLPAVELHTIGRSTGKRRSTMLTSPIHAGDRYVLVASKGGDDRHPQWYLNLVANPDVELTVAGRTLPMRARTASAEEKARLWSDIVAANPGYAAYQRRTRRDIPVVICEPRE